MPKRFTAWVLILGSGLSLLGCQSQPVGAAAPSPTVPKAEQPVSQPLPAAEEHFLASGPIVVENQVEVAAQREGVVAELLADTGAVVQRGQLLARLDDRQLTADRDAAAAQTQSIEADVKNWEASVKVAEADKQRSEQMFAAQLITQQQVDHDRYKLVATQYETDRERENYKRSLAAQRSLELEMEKTRITAPFDGVVGRRYIRVGQRVAKDEKLFWVSATGPLQVKFTLSQDFLGKVKKGSSLTVIPAAFAQESHAAKVLMVSPVVDPASGTIEVTAQLTGPAGVLRPGMIVNIRQGLTK